MVKPTLPQCQYSWLHVKILFNTINEVVWIDNKYINETALLPTQNSFTTEMCRDP
jgi:hypothetical protein